MKYKTDKRIIFKNTLYLYVRQIFVVLISLYSIRVVLDQLGVIEFGIYSVIAGIVTISSFLSSSMASSTQRYFSYALGRDDQKLLNKTFSVNLSIYILISFLAFIFLETFGLWFVQHHLNLPIGKYEVGQTVYHFTVATLLFGILSSPFLAIIISHEKMKYFAVISITEALLKLLAAICLSYFSGDSLMLYSLFLLIVSVVIFLFYFLICLIKFKECQFRNWYWDRNLFFDIINFTGWTLFGQFSSVLRMQGVTVLINQFFSPATVSARAIALSIATQVSAFSTAFNTGLYPSIIKNYSAGNQKELFDIVIAGSKVTFFLMLIFSLPLITGMELLLSFWLKEVPIYAVVFSQLAIVEALILSISFPLATAARAPGKMRRYELTLGSMQLLMVVIIYFVLNYGFSAYSVYVVAIIMNLLMFSVRLRLVSNLIGLPINLYVRSVILPILKVLVIPILYISISFYYGGSEISTISFTLSIFIVTLGAVIILGIDKYLRKMILKTALSRFKFIEKK